MDDAAEWFDARLGCVSASCFGEIFTPTGKPATGAKVENYANKLIAETIMQKPIESFKSDAMERGNELEAEARNWYELAVDVDVSECGLIYLNDLEAVSCSPDGLIIDDAAIDGSSDVVKGLEIKCPLAHTHIKYLMKGELPTQYIPQLQGSMFVADCGEWDFLSYHPDLKPLLITVKRNDEWIDNFKPVLDKFVKRIQDGVNQLTEQPKAA
jgi:hypothetical protein